MDTEKYIQSQQLSNYCLICDADLANSHNALNHYSSKRHKETVKMFRKEYSQQQRTASCDICNVQFLETEAGVHYEGDEHKRKEETFCKVCKVTTSSKSNLWQHLLGSKHKTKTVELGLTSDQVQYGPFDSTLPRELKKAMLAELCKLCNTKLPTIKNALEHYKTNKHCAKVRKWFKEKREISKSLTSSNQSLESITTKKKEFEPVTYIRQSQAPNFRCYVCKLEIQEDSEVADHKTTFPHPQLARLKSNLVCTGTPEEYFSRQGSSIVCNISSVVIRTPDLSRSHFNSRGHGLNFMDWCVLSLKGSKVLSESEIKWFYCRVCSVPLDGTSDAEKHYLDAGHLKNTQLFCKACDVLSSSEQALAIHRCTPLHLENLKRPRNTTDSSETASNLRPMPLWTFAKENLREQGQMETIQTINSTPGVQTHLIDNMPNNNASVQSVENIKEKGSAEIDIKIEKPDSPQENRKDSGDRESLTTEEIENKADLKNQIMNEIEKMVQNLYWSMKVPHEVALDFLQKVNREVEELKKNYEKNIGEELSAQHENGEDDLRAESSSKILPADEEFHSFNTSHFLVARQPYSCGGWYT